MDELVLHTTEEKKFRKTLRICLFIIGGAIFVLSTGTAVSSILLKIVGMTLFITAVVNPVSIFGAGNKLQITDEFVRITDEMSLTRTAYWSKIKKIVMSKFSLRIYYRNGSGEQFRVPYLTSDKFEQLREGLSEKSEEHQFKIQEKPWWKVF